MELTLVELTGRLVVAAGLGIVVGVERDSSARGAGARTHALVSLGAALFTVAGAYGFGDIERTANVDPARIAAQVATGVGFIGAGAIIRNGTSVQGVTTAATVRSVPAAARWSGAPRRHGRSRWTCVARPRARGPAHRPLARLPRRGVSAGGGAPM